MLTVGKLAAASAAFLVVVSAAAVAAGSPSDSGTTAQLDRIDQNAYQGCVFAAGTDAARQALCAAPPTTAPPTTPPPSPTPTPTPTGTGYVVGAGTPSAMTFPEKPGLLTDTATLMPYTGPNAFTTGTFSYSNCIITHQIHLDPSATADVTFTNCWIKVSVFDSTWGMIGKGGRLHFDHDLIDGTGFGDVTFPVIIEGTGDVRFSEFVGNTDNLRVDPSAAYATTSTVEWNWFHAPKAHTATGGAHSDGIEVYYGKHPAGVVEPHIFVRNNYFQLAGAEGLNSSINVTNDFGPIDGVRIEGNTMLPGGNYSLYLRGDGYCGCGGNLADIQVVNNRWYASTADRWAGYYGVFSYQPEVGVTTWSGNTLTRADGVTVVPVLITETQP